MSNGNGEAKILEKAFQELAGGCEFTKEERKLLEKLDDVLKNADIMVSKDGTSATIVTSNKVKVVGAYPDKGTEREENPNKFDFSSTPRDITDTKANSDAKILNEAYKALKKEAGGLSNNDRELIEELDKLLKKADIVVGKNVSEVTIVQDDGKVYTQGHESFADRARGR